MRPAKRRRRLAPPIITVEDTHDDTPIDVAPPPRLNAQPVAIPVPAEAPASHSGEPRSPTWHTTVDLITPSPGTQGCLVHLQEGGRLSFIGQVRCRVLLGVVRVEGARLSRKSGDIVLRAMATTGALCLVPLPLDQQTPVERTAEGSSTPVTGGAAAVIELSDVPTTASLQYISTLLGSSEATHHKPTAEGLKWSRVTFGLSTCHFLRSPCPAEPSAPLPSAVFFPEGFLRSTVDKLVPPKTFTRGAPVIVVVGLRNTGKTTLARYVANQLLHHYEEVAWLEADVGQCHGTPSGMVSLTLHRQPLCGLTWSHTPDRQHYVGEPTVRNVLTLFLHCVHDLLNHYGRTVGPRGVPLIINTHGWICGLGGSTTGCLLRMAKPDAVLSTTPAEMGPTGPHPIKKGGDTSLRWTPFEVEGLEGGAPGWTHPDSTPPEGHQTHFVDMEAEWRKFGESHSPTNGGKAGDDDGPADTDDRRNKDTSNSVAFMKRGAKVHGITLRECNLVAYYSTLYDFYATRCATAPDPLVPRPLSFATLLQNWLPYEVGCHSVSIALTGVQQPEQVGPTIATVLEGRLVGLAVLARKDQATLSQTPIGCTLLHRYPYAHQCTTTVGVGVVISVDGGVLRLVTPELPDALQAVDCVVVGGADIPMSWRVSDQGAAAPYVGSTEPALHLRGATAMPHTLHPAPTRRP